MSETPVPEQDAPDQKAVDALTAALKTELYKQQDPVYAIVGGLASALLCAVIWAVITVSTKYQIGYMAIGVGLLVGFSVRYFGAGIDKYFGVIGAFFALLGCVLGNLLSQVGFIADAESMGYFETFTLLNFNLILEIYKNSFSPMDIVFYGIAGYEGFRFAFRNVPLELANAVAAGKVMPPPYANLRLPLVIGLFVGLSILSFAVSKASEGVRTFLYESGNKRAAGGMSGGLEVGPWQSWWENGNVQSQGNYVDGQPDSTWSYFDEEGNLFRTVTYTMGVEHGTWAEFFTGGPVYMKGQYQNGRRNGPWMTYNEAGGVTSKGDYLLDLPNGAWEYYYDDGKVSASGSFVKGIKQGHWTLWFDGERKSQELDYGTEGEEHILNQWSAAGKAEIIDGKGEFKSFYDDGQLRESGKIVNGLRSGVWKSYFQDGSAESEGEYKEGIYFLKNEWTPDGKQMVTNGEGTHESTYPDGTVSESGPIESGLRIGYWVTYVFGGNNAVLMDYNYVGGKLEGAHNTYFEDGTLNIEGMMSNGKRTGEWTWYLQDGTVESTIAFIDGKKEGIQNFYDVRGELIRTETYKDGELTESKIGI